MGQGSSSTHTKTAVIRFTSTVEADAQAALDEYLEYLHDSGGDEVIENEINAAPGLTVTQMVVQTDGYTFDVASTNPLP
ncbi:MAG: hypothetical protein AAGJ10_16670 [Bacteroidota bacterium]